MLEPKIIEVHQKRGEEKNLLKVKEGGAVNGMKNLKITPLNLVAALAVVLLVFSFLPDNPSFGKLLKVNVGPLFQILFLSLFLVAIITDFIFRIIFKVLAKVWMIEIIFIALTILLFIIFRYSFGA
ncbi:MAG: hypothetical protein EOO99_06720 [Pedobacter sp.]|nr:MAG: hypothetical protein EOO99_06720 [Pedobacter sp.]